MHRPMFLFALVFGISCALSLQAADLPRPVESILKDLGITTPMQVVTVANTEECEGIPKHPGLVAADFDGNGGIDYAVLLETKAPKETTQWGGRDWKKIEVVLAVLINSDSRKYRVLMLEKFESFQPAPMFITLQKPGSVRDKASGKRVRIPRHGVQLTFCGKSAKAWYWSQGSFKEVWLSD